MTTIEVTADDIEQGEPCEGDACPIHRAMRRVVKPGVKFSVGFNRVHFFPFNGGGRNA